MSYAAEISRVNPTAFIFLIDQSGSMGEPLHGGVGKTKQDGVADAINRLLQTLVVRCAKSEGVRDYFHVAVIGYGDHAAPALGGELSGRKLVPIGDIANHPLRVEQRTKKVADGAGGLVDQTIKFPIWFDPVAQGSTPMREAFELGRDIVMEFVGRTPRSFPPIVLNITDGAADTDPEAAAESIRNLATEDGDVLLFNLHLSNRQDGSIVFPASDVELPDEFAGLLFRMSSVLPSHLLDAARREGFKVGVGARGFAFNADLVLLVQFLDIGTRLKNL